MMWLQLKLTLFQPSETGRQLKLYDIANISRKLFEKDELENLCLELKLADEEIGHQFSIYKGDYVRAAYVLLVIWFDKQQPKGTAYTNLCEALIQAGQKNIVRSYLGYEK